nr:hypothetical protein [Tanacetum cinerariifolium]
MRKSDATLWANGARKDQTLKQTTLCKWDYQAQLNEYLQNGAVSRPDMRGFVNSVNSGGVECEDMKDGSPVKLIVDALLQHFPLLAGRRIKTTEAQVKMFHFSVYVVNLAVGD